MTKLPSILAATMLVLFGATLEARADTVTVDGVKRTFTYSCPTGGCVLGLPVVFGFHGHLQQPAGFRNNTGLDARGVKAIFVFPLGTPGLMPSWNAGADPAQVSAEKNGVDDVGFVEAMIAYLDAKYHIDHSRIYATGNSNGAQFVWELACTTTLFAAIAPVAGPLNDPNCPPDSHPPILVISGTADNVEKWGGNGLGGDLPFQPGIDLFRSAGSQVTVLRPVGGGHTWDQPGIDTTGTVLRFFGFDVSAPSS